MDMQGEEETGLRCHYETGFEPGSESRSQYCLAQRSHELAWAGLGQQAAVKSRASEVLATPSPCIGTRAGYPARQTVTSMSANIGLSTLQASPLSKARGHRCPSVCQQHSNHLVEEASKKGESHLMGNYKVSSTTPGATHSLTHLVLPTTLCGRHGPTHF